MQITHQQISNIYRRMLYKYELAPINIRYTSSNNWYDSTLTFIPNNLLSFLPINADQSLIDSHIYFINDPINFSQLDNNYNTTSCKILFFHEPALAYMKKEDLFLLNDKLKKYKKYTFTKALSDIINNVQPINYGFSIIDQSNLIRRQKDILFVGQGSNVDHVIFNRIKQIYPDSDFLNSQVGPSNIDDILLKYKICINFDSEYNILLAAARGCITISSNSLPYIPHHYTLNNINSLMDIIKYIYKDYNPSKHITNHDFVTKEYSYSDYIENLQNIIDNSIETVSFL